MKLSNILLLLPAATATPSPSILPSILPSTPPSTSRQQSYGGLKTCYLASFAIDTNPFVLFRLNPQRSYREKVLEFADSISNASMKKKALNIAATGTFLWLDSVESISQLVPAIDRVKCGEVLGIVIKGLSSVPCRYKSSPSDELKIYKSDFIDPIADILKNYDTTAFALVIEPNVLSSIATSGKGRCSNLEDAYKKNVPYALKKFNLRNVVTYIDAGNGKRQGQMKKVKKIVELITKVFTAAERPANVRGIATNVGGYNSFNVNPLTNNTHMNESNYIKTITPYLKNLNIPHHAIVDSSSNGIANLPLDPFSIPCDEAGPGFGPPFTRQTGLEEVDAMLWIANGGIMEGPGTSSSQLYENECADLNLDEMPFVPRFEKGAWNETHFEILVKNAAPGISEVPTVEIW